MKQARPKINDSLFESKDLKNVMIKCWNQKSNERPTLSQVQTLLNKI